MEESVVSPSFSCYSSDSLTSTVAAKVIREARIHEFGEVVEEDFEFSFVLSGEQVSAKDIDSRGWTVFPVFNTNLLLKHDIKEKEEERHECSSNSPSETVINKSKKSSSTGSGLKRWSIRHLLRRSNSEGKEPSVLLTPKKVDTPKQKRNSGEVSVVTRRLKVQTALYEQFYVQRRAENEISKRKSYLPYRQDLVGFFANVKEMRQMIPVK